MTSSRADAGEHGAAPQLGAGGAASGPDRPAPSANASKESDSKPAARPRWDSYGFDLANSQVNPAETELDAKNVARLRENWRAQISDGATSTPIIYDGMAYFGGWDGYIYAVDAESGALKWQRRLTSTSIRSTPLATAERVFAAAGGDLVALDRSDGKVLFQTSLDDNLNALPILEASPKLIQADPGPGWNSLMAGVLAHSSGTVRRNGP